MKHDRDHISTYTAADIQKYLKGDMLAEDMHAMEKAALDDPFLADAIEGMEQTMQEDPAVIDVQLTDLRRRLAARTGSEKTAPVVMSFRWWYAAAAASVVILAGIWLFRENASTKQEPLATTLENKQAEKAGDSSLQLADGKSITIDSVAAADLAKQPATGTVIDSYKSIPPAVATLKAADKTIPAAKPEPPKAEEKVFHFSTDHLTTESAANQPQAKPEQVIQPDVAHLKKDTVTLKNKEFFANTSAPAPNREEKLNDLLRNRQAGITLVKDKKSIANNAVFDSVNMPTEVVKVTDDLKKQEYKFDNGYSNNSNLQNFIKGRVVDQYNNPLSNAALRLNNNRNIYATDQMGYFKIPATTDSVMNISVNAVGYQPQQFKLNTQQAATTGYVANVASNNLRLQANSLALNEVVVRGASAPRKASRLGKAPSVMVQDAAPNYGWVLFEQYLQKNKRPPADNPLVTGEVVVSFTVDRKGALSDFTIEQPLAKGYDEDAIRLVKEGPAWKLNKGRKAKVTVIVRY